jgi:hypothetical protein
VTFLPPRWTRAPHRALAIGLAAALAATSGPLLGQSVVAPNDEARTLPAGVFRLSVADSNSHYSELYGPGGTPVPVLAGLSVDSLGVRTLPRLGPAQTAIQSLSGLSNFNLSLGNTTVTSSVRVQTIPVAFEAGITRWLTLRVMVPIVNTRTDIFANINSNRFEGNVGLNPTLNPTSTISTATALAADVAVVNQFNRASSILKQALANCRTSPGSPGCPTIISDSAAVRALINQAAAFASGVGTVYGGPAGTGSQVVPITGTNAQHLINAKDSTLTSQINGFFKDAGLTSLTTLLPTAAPSRAGLSDLTSLITQSVYGYGYDSLQTATHTGIGDAEVSATVRLYDSFASDTDRFHPNGFNVRTAVTGLVRLGTGKPPDPNSLSDVGTGTGENALEIHEATDFLYGRHWWASVIVRGTYQLSDHLVTRIPDQTGQALIPSYAETTVGRTLGDAVQFEFDPRYIINSYFSITGAYLYYHKAADKYTGSLTVDSSVTGVATETLNASTLGIGTGGSYQRLGFGLTFSTLDAASRGRIHIPVDISYLHSTTFGGTGGYLPITTDDAVVIRLYLRLFGSSSKDQRNAW